ncbi:protein-tyrosine phosphatase-like protein [Glomus cerebriforme]|uniref:Protein-tyrosine phosphatase-like protein n=1 Tax=Glomus cerebriforme TaxID=658196 RepID=A0A397SJ17_9GLOM|nr:protein-tyrosine phosphatase-like protein [Glomus cerebriforme]
MSEEHLPNIPIFLSDAQNLDQETLSNKFYKICQAEMERSRSNHYNDLSSPFSTKTAMSKTSMKFNRYSDIIPFDCNRIKLHSKRSGNNTDYINASFIEAPQKLRKYIATQGPLENTFEDFWCMVWEQRSYVIVMLTKEHEKGTLKCSKYWPDLHGNPMIFQELGLKIEMESEELEPSSSSLIRTFRLEKFNSQGNSISASQGGVSQLGDNIEIRRVTQLHFVGWPDHGVPDSPEIILNLIKKTNEFQLKYQNEILNEEIGPPVIHCSAGCGRTGTFCTIDSCLVMLPLPNDDGTDLIEYLVNYFREQRRTMVQTLGQFQYCYLAVLSKLVINK